MSARVSGKVLLTGASGFIGTRLRDRLEADGCDVVTLRRAASPQPKRGASVAADYDDVEGLVRVMRDVRPDYVLHVAGVTKGVEYADFRAGNVMPTENLLTAVRKADLALRRFVLVSSLAAYGPAREGRPVRESDAKRPIEHYGRSKMEAEAVLEVDRSIPWTIVRPSGVYGPGDVDYFELYKLAASGLNAYYGNKDRWQSNVYVDDCIDAILLASAHERSVHEGYFVCDGQPCTWGDYQSEVARLAGRRVLTLHLPEAFVGIAAHAGELATRIDKKPRLFNRQKALMGAQEAWTCSGEQAESHLGFKPKISMKEGIARTFAWYRENGWIR